jgi:hypothetical protein
MSIWNKVLVGFIFIAALVFGYMTIRALKTQQYWEGLVKIHQEKLADVLAKNKALVEAEKLENGNLGTVLAKRELDRVLLGRGRVWSNVAVKAHAGDTVTVEPEQTTSSGITPKMTLYVIEENDVQKGGRYLGEFEVAHVDVKKVVLSPTRPLDPDEEQRLAKSHGPWSLYEIMPVDKHDAFVDIDKAELDSLLPAGSRIEYEKDGKPAAPGDDKQFRVDTKGNYVRLLRDYQAIYESYHLQRALFADLYDAAKRDFAYMHDSCEDAKVQEQFREKEVADLTVERDAGRREQNAAEKHQSALAAKLDAMQKDVARRLKYNLELAKEIVTTQLDAARRIDERTRTVARGGAALGPGAN